MASTTNQPTSNPTNKLTAATIAASIMGIVGLILRNMAPDWYDPAVLATMLPLVVYGTGWMIPDSPNIVVNIPEDKT